MTTKNILPDCASACPSCGSTSSCPLSKTDNKETPKSRLKPYLMSAQLLFVLLFLALFLFRNYIPEPWPALLTVILFALYVVLRHVIRYLDRKHEK